MAFSVYYAFGLFVQISAHEPASTTGRIYMVKTHASLGIGVHPDAAVLADCMGLHHADCAQLLYSIHGDFFDRQCWRIRYHHTL